MNNFSLLLISSGHYTTTVLCFPGVFVSVCAWVYTQAFKCIRTSLTCAKLTSLLKAQLMDSVVIRAISIPVISTSFLLALSSAHFSLRMVAATAMVKPVIWWREKDSLLLVLTSFVFCCVSLCCSCDCFCCWVFLPLIWLVFVENLMCSTYLSILYLVKHLDDFLQFWTGSV